MLLNDDKMAELGQTFEVYYSHWSKIVESRPRFAKLKNSLHLQRFSFTWLDQATISKVGPVYSNKFQENIKNIKNWIVLKLPLSPSPYRRRKSAVISKLADYLVKFFSYVFPLVKKFNSFRASFVQVFKWVEKSSNISTIVFGWTPSKQIFCLISQNINQFRQMSFIGIKLIKALSLRLERKMSVHC